MPKLPPVDALEQTALRSDPTTETVAPPQRPSMSRLPVDGDRVGRYVIEGAIARGGTGAVFRAHDPELGRSIAIKLIHPDIAAASDRFEQRLLRESKAMARVAHPNVLTIHDIGRLEGQVFIAMELALGGTLRTWLAAERRDQREVITRFVLAGRGLRAAHEMGLVHRDFKPDNVLLTGDGDVRVADFGLVGHIDAPSHEPGDHASSSDVMLTQVGARMGTPRYMAPEQHEGAQTGAAADQFAFAVAFYEALYDEHPFGGGSWHELAIAVTEGHLRPAPANSDVPPALRKILVRALRVDPQERWPSMTALLDALDAHLARKPVAEPSEPALRARVAQLRRELDDASALAEGGQYEGALPRLRALGADAIAINHPPVAADTLFALGALQNNMGDLRGAEATLTAAVVEAARARDDGLAAKIWNEYMLVLIRAGRLSDAVLLRPAAEAAFARCADDDALAHGQYLNTLGLIAERRGFYPEALASFEGAAHVFEDEFGANSPQLGRAVNNIGYTQQRLGRYREAREAFERAHRIIEVALGPEHPWAAIAINNLGELYVDAGDLTAGLAHHEQAFELRTRALRDDHPHLALSMHNLGVVLTALGRTGEARTHLENALAIRTAGLGENHVETAESLAALGTTLVADGACDDGVALLRRALAIVADNAWIRRTIASIEDQLGAALLVAGRPAEALDHHERALAILEAAFSPDYPHVARSLAGIARAAQALGQHARAESATARAREIANLRTLA